MPNKSDKKANLKEPTNILIPEEHSHQFAIPVEWVFIQNKNVYGEVMGDPRYNVTKLRCSCGEETER